MNNKSLCKHKDGFKFAFYFVSAGFKRPVHNAVFFCPYCLRIKTEQIKE